MAGSADRCAHPRKRTEVRGAVRDLAGAGACPATATIAVGDDGGRCEHHVFFCVAVQNNQKTIDVVNIQTSVTSGAEVCEFILGAAEPYLCLWLLASTFIN